MSRFSPHLASLADDLLAAGCIKFGEFTLKSGLQSPIYITPVRDKTKPNLLDIVHAAHNGGTSMRDGTDHTDYTDFSVNLNDVRAFRDIRVQQKTLARIHVILICGGSSLIRVYWSICGPHFF